MSGGFVFHRRPGRNRVEPKRRWSDCRPEKCGGIHIRLYPGSRDEGEKMEKMRKGGIGNEKQGARGRPVILCRSMPEAYEGCNRGF